MISELDIVIPVFNEGKSILRTIESICEYLPNSGVSARILIVYDSEDDDTLPVIRKSKEKYCYAIETVQNPDCGVLNAIKKGFSVSCAEYVLVTMADGSDDYEILPEMIRMAREGYDIICASRYMKSGKQIGGPFIKKMLSWAGGVSLHYLTGLPTHDATNSYKLYRKSVIDSLDLESTGGFEIGLEITVKAYMNGRRIAEIPAIWRDRAHGKSRFKLIKWLPKYMKWYFFLIKGRFFNRDQSA